MLIRILLCSALLTGCSGSFRALQGAPDWYDERRVEIAGKGYPRVAEIPEVTAENRPGTELPVQRAALDAAELDFRTDPRAQLPTTTAADMEAFVDLALSEFAPVSTPPDLLTMDEVEAMRRLFDRYPVGG